MTDYPKFSDLQGKTLKRIDQIGDERIEFETDEGKNFALYHSQVCCENVRVEDVCGDFADLVGSPILLAEEAVSEDGIVPHGCELSDDSNTWTFYKLRTLKGSVDIRWHGSSSGYYSESVSFVALD